MLERTCLRTLCAYAAEPRLADMPEWPAHHAQNNLAARLLRKEQGSGRIPWPSISRWPDSPMEIMQVRLLQSSPRRFEMSILAVNLELIPNQDRGYY